MNTLPALSVSDLADMGGERPADIRELIGRNEDELLTYSRESSNLFVTLAEEVEP